MPHAQDHFSAIAKEYAKGRIAYPDELYRYLESICPQRSLAWDCATGSGQAAISLAQIFEHVIATDISADLLKLAPQHPKISYRCASAEESGLESDSTDLIIVAQAIHWFDLDTFWQETERVLKPGGVLAFWGYNWPQANSETNRLLEDFKQTIAPCWPERSAILHGEYCNVNPPMEAIPTPSLHANAIWQADDYLNHLKSWSGTRYYREQTGIDLVSKHEEAFREAWGNEEREVSWPLAFKAFRKS